MWGEGVDVAEHSQAAQFCASPLSDCQMSLMLAIQLHFSLHFILFPCTPITITPSPTLQISLHVSNLEYRCVHFHGYFSHFYRLYKPHLLFFNKICFSHMLFPKWIRLMSVFRNEWYAVSTRNFVNYVEKLRLTIEHCETFKPYLKKNSITTLNAHRPHNPRQCIYSYLS